MTVIMMMTITMIMDKNTGKKAMEVKKRLNNSKNKKKQRKKLKSVNKFH